MVEKKIQQSHKRIIKEDIGILSPKHRKSLQISMMMISDRGVRVTRPAPKALCVLYLCHFLDVNSLDLDLNLNIAGYVRNHLILSFVSLVW